MPESVTTSGIGRHPPRDAAVPMPARVSTFSVRHRAARAAWGVVQVLLFRPSPRIAHRWRNLLLRLFGAKLHGTARVYPRARCWAPWNLTMHEHSCVGDDVDIYSAESITIGAYSTVSQYGYLCTATHDPDDVRHPLVVKPISIGRRCWLAADVFVAPGVTIGDGAVVGARSAVFKDLPEWVVCAGTPARPIRARGVGPKDFGEAP